MRTPWWVEARQPVFDWNHLSPFDEFRKIDLTRVILVGQRQRQDLSCERSVG